MHFMADMYIKCDDCKGSRYNRETLEITYRGKNISDVLNNYPIGYKDAVYDKFFDTSKTATGSFDQDYSGSFGSFVDPISGELDYTTSRYIAAGTSDRVIYRSISDTEYWVPYEFTLYNVKRKVGAHWYKDSVQGARTKYKKKNEHRRCSSFARSN